MSSPDYDFLRRMRSVDRDLGSDVGPPDVARVHLVQNSTTWNNSRERAPIAQHWEGFAAGGAGVHNGLVFSASDQHGGRALAMLHSFLFNPSTGSTVTFSLGLVPLSSLTLASGPTPIVPLMVDADADVAPLVSRITIATANIPAFGVAGWSNNYPAAQFTKLADLPSAVWFIAPERVLFIIHNGANEPWNWRALWQAARL